MRFIPSGNFQFGIPREIFREFSGSASWLVVLYSLKGNIQLAGVFQHFAGGCFRDPQVGLSGKDEVDMLGRAYRWKPWSIRGSTTRNHWISWTNGLMAIESHEVAANSWIFTRASKDSVDSLMAKNQVMEVLKWSRRMMDIFQSRKMEWKDLVPCLFRGLSMDPGGRPTDQETISLVFQMPEYRRAMSPPSSLCGPLYEDPICEGILGRTHGLMAGTRRGFVDEMVENWTVLIP